MSNSTANNDVRFVNLSCLVPSPQNVRRYQSDVGIDELAASLSATGQIQDIRVRQPKEDTSSGKLEVVAGSRRLKALHTLLKNRGTIKGVKVTKAYQVRVSFQAADDSDIEVSLAENDVRLNMHPADQVTAFYRLHVDEGLTPEAIAERFGVNQITIRRRLKLACVSPKIMEEFRADTISLEQMMALALTDDHERQEEAYFNVEQDWQRSPSHLKSRLAKDTVRGSDRLAKFVGKKAYEAAGGAVTRDLFAEDDETFWTDRDLVHRLATARLSKKAKQYEGLGWKWIDVSLDGQFNSNGRIVQKMAELSEADLERVAELTAISKMISKEWDELVEPDEAVKNELRTRFQNCQDANEAIRAPYGYFDAAEMAFAGVLVQINREGKLEVHSGLTIGDDLRALDAFAKGQRTVTGAQEDSFDAEAGKEDAAEAPALSMAVVEDLTALRSAALTLAVSERTDIALCIAIHALAKPEFYALQYSGSIETASEIRCNGPHLRLATIDPDNNSAFDEIIRKREVWQMQLPEKQSDLWEWLLAQQQAQLLELLAFLVGMSVNAWQVRHQSGTRFIHANQIADAVQLDMKTWWKPSETFFKRIPMSVAIEAMRETKAKPELLSAMSKVKKSEAILGALDWLDGSQWLPTVLRPAESKSETKSLSDNVSHEPDLELDHEEPVQLMAAE